MEDRTGDFVLFPSHDVSEPCTLPLHADGSHAVLISSGEMSMIGDGLRPEYVQYFSSALPPKFDHILPMADSLHIHFKLCLFLSYLTQFLIIPHI